MTSQPRTELSSRPERTRISCHAALDKTTCAPIRKEGRMKYTSATNFHRKSGVAKWRDLQFSGPLLEVFFDRSVALRQTGKHVPAPTTERSWAAFQLLA